MMCINTYSLFLGEKLYYTLFVTTPPHKGSISALLRLYYGCNAFNKGLRKDCAIPIGHIGHRAHIKYQDFSKSIFSRMSATSLRSLYYVSKEKE